LSTQPSYKPAAGIAARSKFEMVDGATVRRISLRSDRDGPAQKLLNTVLFPLAVAVHLLCGRRHDVVMCSTAPPVLLGVAVAAAAHLRGTRFVYHCMDLHPEIGLLSGDFTNPWVYRSLRALDAWTCRRAVAVVVLSEDMRDVLIARDPTIASRIHIINNCELPDYAAEVSEPDERAPLPVRAEGSVRMVFTGNIGRFQGLQGLVAAALGDDAPLADLDLVLMGDGVALLELKAMVDASATHKRARVTFLPHGSPGDARELMRAADVGLVSLTPGVIRYAYPSKTATYLSEGLPVVAVVEADSELARMVTEQRIGWVAIPNDVEALRRVLIDLLASPQALRRMGRRAAEVGKEQFGRDSVLDRWERLLPQLRDRAGFVP